MRHQRGAAILTALLLVTLVATLSAAALWQQDQGFTLVCFRSVAAYVMGLLSHSAQPGSEL